MVQIIDMLTTIETQKVEVELMLVQSVANIGGQIAGILTTVGMVVAVIVLLVLGIKYMMGSASEKAEYKKTMIPYIVGAILILGASAIVKIIFNISIS